MLKKLSLKGKILGICLSLASFSAVLGVVGVFALRGVVEKYDHIASLSLPNVDLLGKMLAEFRFIRVNMGQLGLSGLSDESGALALKNIEKGVANYTKADKEYNDIPFSPGEEERYRAINESWNQFIPVMNKVVAAYKDPTQKEKISSILQNEEQKIVTAYAEKMESLLEYHRNIAYQFATQAKSISSWSMKFMGGLALVALVISVMIATLFSGAIGRVLFRLAERLSQGADEVATASGQVSSASESLSSSASEQAAALQETASSVEQLSATITKNSENAQESRKTSEQSHLVATRGKEAMDEMAQAIVDIRSSTENMVNQIGASNLQFAEITRVIAEIGDKTKVINDIVFQTKLLSFNASVEAARAGENGKGFAVVAEEVANLAAMSGKSAREITSMLDSSIKKVEGIVNESKERIDLLVTQGAEKVAKGTEIAKRCGGVLVEIVENASSVSHRISQISDASKEQESGVREITKAMELLNQVTQQNAAASQQAATASSELSAQAEALRKGVGELETLIRGQGGETAQSGQMTQGAVQKSSNVVALTPPRTEPTELRPVFKMAVGGQTPADADPRFKEI